MIGIGIDTGGTYTDAVVYDLEKREIMAGANALNGTLTVASVLFNIFMAGAKALTTRED